MGLYKEELIQAVLSNYTKLTFVKTGRVVQWTQGNYRLQLSGNTLSVFEGTDQKISVKDERIGELYRMIWYDLNKDEESTFEQTVINFLNNLA